LRTECRAFVKDVRFTARLAAAIALLSLLASLVVCFERVRIERETRRVELAMDYGDFLALARSYNYNPTQFLIALRRAGLTTLALSEELGSSIPASPNAYETSGVQLLDAARLSPVSDPTLGALVRDKKIRSDEVYLLVYDKPTYARYLAQLPLHFERSGIRVLHAKPPYVIAIRTQIDYFGGIALGIPSDQVALARKLGFFIAPRFQNDERMDGHQAARLFGSLHDYRRVSTAIFFGMRNQVLGFPNHVRDVAEIMKAHRGLVSVADNPGGGARFTLSFPPLPVQSSGGNGV